MESHGKGATGSLQAALQLRNSLFQDSEGSNVNLDIGSQCKFVGESEYHITLTIFTIC